MCLSVGPECDCNYAARSSVCVCICVPVFVHVVIVSCVRLHNDDANDMLIQASVPSLCCT